MSTITKFKNNKFEITLAETLKADNNINIVTKNIPFLLVVEPKKSSSITATNKLKSSASNLFQTLTKDKVSLKLVYENDLENKVNSLKTNPLDYNIYIKDQSITVETRIQTLSSKHENNLFKIILVLDGQSLYTESIRCVSKITNTVAATASHNNNITHTDNNNNNNNIKPESPAITTFTNRNNNNTVKKSKSQIISSPLTKHTSELAKTIKKLKKLRQNDKNLITLLYQQNKLITTQLNSVSSIVNTLVTKHNLNSNNTNINNINSNYNYQSSPPSHEAPQSPTTFSLPPSPTNSSPPTPFVAFQSESASSTCDSMKIQQYQSNDCIQDYQFPLIDADVLKSMSTDESCYSFPSDSSQSFTDYQFSSSGDCSSSSSQQHNNVVGAASSCSTSFNNEVRLIESQLKLKSSLTNNVLEQHKQANVDETIYSHPSSSFTFDLDFNLLGGSQNGFNVNHQMEDQVL